MLTPRVFADKRRNHLTVVVQDLERVGVARDKVFETEPRRDWDGPTDFKRRKAVSLLRLR